MVTVVIVVRLYVGPPAWSAGRPEVAETDGVRSELRGGGPGKRGSSSSKPQVHSERLLRGLQLQQESQRPAREVTPERVRSVLRRVARPS